MPTPYQRLLQRLGHRAWFAALGRSLVPVDLWLDRASRGRIRFGGGREWPQLLLTTTGRRTGEPRTTPLLYAHVDDDWVIAATNWGRGHHPGWSANLLANPDAVIEIGTSRIDVRATRASGCELDRLWPALLGVWPAYDTYAERSGRDIRVFRLRRR